MRSGAHAKVAWVPVTLYPGSMRGLTTAGPQILILGAHAEHVAWEIVALVTDHLRLLGVSVR